MIGISIGVIVTVVGIIVLGNKKTLIAQHENNKLKAVETIHLEDSKDSLTGGLDAHTI